MLIEHRDHRRPGTVGHDWQVSQVHLDAIEVRHLVADECVAGQILDAAEATIRDLRARAIQSNDLVTRLANDDRIPLDQGQLDAIFEDETRLSGMAQHQVNVLSERVAAIAGKYPEATSFKPGKIL